MSATTSSVPVALHRSRWLWMSVAVLLVVLVLPHWIAPYQLSLVTEILIYALFAMSIDFLAGYTGRVSLCHGAIFGMATYVVVYMTANMGLPFYVAVICGVIAATLLAAVFAVLAIRTSDVYFLLLTLALGMIVWGICLRWTSMTGGENGLRGAGRPELFSDHMAFYYLVVVFAVAVTYIMWRIVKSPFGLTLQGIKDSASRMQALGYNVPLHLFLAFTISGFFAGVAGALYALFNNFVSPSTVGLLQSVDGLLMAIIGGVGTLFGAFIGAAVIIGLENIVSFYTERWQIFLGTLFVVVVIFAPEGILGTIRRRFGN